MRFACTIYILIVVFAENEEKLMVRCIARLEEKELVHLSENLNRVECLQLVKAVYELTPTRFEDEGNSYGIANQGSNRLSPTSKECLVDLEQWNNDYPKNIKPSGRSAMEMTLRWLGRPDLAKYVRENHRPIKYMDTKDYDVAGTLEFPGHSSVSRRHVPKNDKNSPKNERMKKEKKKQGHHKHKHSHNSVKKNKGAQKAVAAPAKHAASNKTHQLSKNGDLSHNRSDYVEQPRPICCSILLVLLFLMLCLVTVYFLHRRNRSKPRGTRFKYDDVVTKADKDTFTDQLEWNDEIVCSCSDVEGGCTGQCSICSGLDQQTNDETECRRNESDVTVKDHTSVCVQKVRRKKKKRQRFGFLQRNIQNKKTEKDQENWDRKKTLEKSVGRRHEKLPIVCEREYRQCVCCKCALTSTEKLLRQKQEEKRELHKLRAKRRKEVKRRKGGLQREESRRAEKHRNTCYNDTCN